jgi:RimJ/RimL family protein N-acetyltransferase
VAWPDVAAARLQNDSVLLRPIVPADRAELRLLARDGEVWRYFVVGVANDDDFDVFFDTLLADQAAGRAFTFCVVERKSGRAAGSMSYVNLAERDRRLEIGLSWLGRDFRGTGVNHWAKFLLLGHAFEVMAAERVEFRTDRLNERARRALRNIGALEEGTLRSYNVMPGGRRRDAVFYGIVRAEWPLTRQRLLARRAVTVPGDGT